MKERERERVKERETELYKIIYLHTHSYIVLPGQRADINTTTKTTLITYYNRIYHTRAASRHPRNRDKEKGEFSRVRFL